MQSRVSRLRLPDTLIKCLHVSLAAGQLGRPLLQATASWLPPPMWPCCAMLRGRMWHLGPRGRRWARALRGLCPQNALEVLADHCMR